jgi:hypothetical protein
MHQLCRIQKRAAADQLVVVKKLLKGNGAKGLACSCLRISDNHKMG